MERNESPQRAGRPSTNTHALHRSARQRGTEVFEDLSGSLKRAYSEAPLGPSCEGVGLARDAHGQRCALCEPEKTETAARMDASSDAMAVDTPVPAAEAPVLTERQQWSRQMRLKFSPPEMMFPDGSGRINQEYVHALWRLVVARRGGRTRPCFASGSAES